MPSPLLVCRIAWMDQYRGVTVKDTPTGGGAWVKQHGFGHEAFNFEPAHDEYFGYVQPTGAGINLQKLGGTADDERLEGITVAWVATHPTEGGTRVVGWYREAAVFGEFQAPVARKGRKLPDGNVPRFLVRAQNAVLLDRDERIVDVPRGKGGMGQSNVWYPDATAAAPIRKYIEAGGRRPSSPGRASPTRLMDVERRLRIEKTAMRAVAEWFTDHGYGVVDVSMDRVGWDLEARLHRAQLKLEVKGTSRKAEEFVVEVTPNEYSSMTKYRADYRLCVVTSCEGQPLVTVFAWSGEREAWTSGDGSWRLSIEARIAARISPTLT